MVDKTTIIGRLTWSGETMIRNTILIVDDDPGTLRLLGSILAGVGSIRVATSGRDALRLAREAVPDLILLDAEMPGMTGFEVYEALRADWGCADVPVIFVSSHGEAAFEVVGLGVDFITKPIDADAVLAKVRLRLATAASSVPKLSRRPPLDRAASSPVVREGMA